MRHAHTPVVSVIPPAPGRPRRFTVLCDCLGWSQTCDTAAAALTAARRHADHTAT